MLNIFTRLKNWSDSRGISQQPVSQNDWEFVLRTLDTQHKMFLESGVKGYVLNALEELVEYAEAMSIGDENGAGDAIGDGAVFGATEMVKMGYDIERTYDEVLKVVESRTGRWDNSIGKFQKDQSPEAKARWYAPDYVKNCKQDKNFTASLFGCDTEEHS